MTERTTGLVLHADVAPEGSWRMWRGTVEVLVDLGGRPTPLQRRFRLDERRWLVPGMEVQVDVDPAKPEDFDIDWDAVPSIQDRVAAGDPTLTDPVAAHRRVAEAWGQQPKDPSGRFEQAMERAASTPAPAGQVRAVVRIATIRGNLEGDGDTGGGHARDTTIWGTSAAVLQVNVPGQAPYAVFVKKFKVPRGRIEITGAGLPALVSISDPNAVTVLWDELPSAMSQVETRMGDAMSQVQAAMTAPPQTMPQFADPQFQQTMVEGAKRALSMISDPAQRAALIQQYRAAGIMVEEE
jgi:hypothetical protein